MMVETSKYFFTKEEIIDKIDEYDKIKFNCKEFYISHRHRRHFHGNDELHFAIWLEMRGIYNFVLQFPIQILPAFRTNYKQYKPTNYNADFLIFYKGRKILVEIKGFLRPDKIFLYKVYDYFIAQNYKDYEYYLIKFRGGSKKGEKIPYLQYQHVFKDPNKNNSTLYNFETIVLDKK